MSAAHVGLSCEEISPTNDSILWILAQLFRQFGARSDSGDPHRWDRDNRAVSSGCRFHAAAVAHYGCGSCHIIPGVSGASGLAGPRSPGRSFHVVCLPSHPFRRRSSVPAGLQKEMLMGTRVMKISAASTRTRLLISCGNG
jgi:hypothetical protein